MVLKVISPKCQSLMTSLFHWFVTGHFQVQKLNSSTFRTMHLDVIRLAIIPTISLFWWFLHCWNFPFFRSFFFWFCSHVAIGSSLFVYVIFHCPIFVPLFGHEWHVTVSREFGYPPPQSLCYHFYFLHQFYWLEIDEGCLLVPYEDGCS